MSYAKAVQKIASRCSFNSKSYLCSGLARKSGGIHSKGCPMMRPLVVSTQRCVSVKNTSFMRLFSIMPSMSFPDKSRFFFAVILRFLVCFMPLASRVEKEMKGQIYRRPMLRFCRRGLPENEYAQADCRAIGQGKQARARR